MSDKPFSLIGVNSDELEKARVAVREKDLNWRSFQNSVIGQVAISETWAIEGWPTIVILDTDGKIHYRGHDGMAATKVAEELVAKAMAASSK